MKAKNVLNFFMACCIASLLGCGVEMHAGEGNNWLVLNDLAQGANPNDGLLAAIGQDRLDTVRLLLRHGADPNGYHHHVKGEGHPLGLALLLGHSDVALVLLEHGADPDLARNELKKRKLYKNYVRELLHEVVNNYKAEQQEKVQEVDYQHIKERLLTALRKGPPFPPVSEQYRKEMIIGLQYIRDASTPQSYQKAFKHFLAASALAPWAPQPYKALGRVAETMKEYETSETFLKWYLLASPKASDARAIQDHIYVLEEKAGK